MAPHGRQVATPARDEEQRENGEGNQQGLPIPSPPPIANFNDVMQGLVQVMQTQANAHATLQAQV